MNLNQHTVTIPIADYQELTLAHQSAEQKFDHLKERLLKALDDLERQCSVETRGTIFIVKHAVREAK